MSQFRMIDIKGPQQVRITWEMETPRDDSGDRPDDRDDGFWPSLDPNAAGYIGDHGTDAAMRRYDDAMKAAQERLDAWENDEWEFVGVVAVAHVAIPVGGGSYALHTFRSAGLWGIESDAGDYLKEVFEEEKVQLLASLRTLGNALVVGDYVQQGETVDA